MTDQQCGLCLSCGAPFLPEITQVDFFNRQANLSMLFLNTEFQENRDIRRMYDYPKLCSERQASHMIHKAYHQTALDYMCNRHTMDSDVGLPLPPGAGLRQVQDAANEPFLYYHTASTRHGPQGAVWARPLANTRINLDPLLTFLRRVSRTGRYLQPVAPSFDVMYDMCAGCNLLMTQKSHMRFILGCRNAGTKNTRGNIIRRDAFNQYNAETNGHQLEHAYGHWRLQNNARPRPRLIKTDSDAPCIAYYLHMCLPFRIGNARDGFEMFGVNLRQPVRVLYLELSWLLLEIACLATLNEEGTVTKPRNSKKSHGQHQHLGVLDLYVSYFMWRLMQFEFGRLIALSSLDFVQWHQKYFADARNCPGLLDANEQRVTTGTLMYGTSNQSGQALVSQLCTNIMHFYSVKLSDVIVHAVGSVEQIPPEISNYFASSVVIRLLRARSNQTVRNDFQSAVGKFGINALLFRLIDLCQGYPPEFYNQLLSFRSSWQWREIERVRLANKGLEAKEAYRLYFLCTLLFPPTQDLPKELEEELLFQDREYCSPWTSVIPLENVGAFRYQAIDV